MDTKNPNKTVDLPPTGNRNADPITGAPGSHPIETGIGAAAAGAASGLAAGAVAGPVGAMVGAAVGAIAGGLGGKAVGEAIDPTTDDTYLRENFATRPYAKQEKFETYRPAYQYGGAAEAKYHGKKFDQCEAELKRDWETTHAPKTGLAWDRARDAVKDSFDRTIQLREERLKVNKTSVETGNVNIRKEVITEHKTIEVPVEREELVIEHHAVSGKGVAGDLRSEEIRIPLKEEQVHVTKEVHVKDEVSISKRKVQGTEQVSENIRKEELKVVETGNVNVREKKDVR